MNKKLLISIVSLMTIAFLNRGELLSRIVGYPYGIKKIKREKLGIEPYTETWQRYPRENSLSATHVLINEEAVRVKGHYAKKIFMESGLLRVYGEEDRYLLDFQNNRQIDLVNKWRFKSNELTERSARIESIDQIKLNENSDDWFESSVLIKELTVQEADSLLAEIKSRNTN